MNRIREARTKAGMKQIELSVRLGISQGALSGWENGKYEPDTAGWVNLSKILAVSTDYLMGISDNSIVQTETPPAILDDDHQGQTNKNLIRLAGRDGSIQERYLSDEQLSAVKSILDQLPDASDDL